MKLKLRLLVLFALVLCARVDAREPPKFIPADAVDAVKMLPGPPSADSAEAREELELMVSIQEKRTKEDVARCASEVKLKVDHFASVMGPWFTEKNLPRLAKVFAALESDSKQASNAAKAAYHRPRPEHEDKRIHVPIDDETTFSYPSGHATRGMLYAMLLAELAPDHRDALIDRGREIGWDRVIAGLHHPSDIMAGRVLGKALAQSLLADPKSQPELAALKAEIHEAQSNAAAAQKVETAH